MVPPSAVVRPIPSGGIGQPSIDRLPVSWVSFNVGSFVSTVTVLNRAETETTHVNTLYGSGDRAECCKRGIACIGTGADHDRGIRSARTNANDVRVALPAHFNRQLVLRSMLQC